MNRRYKDGNFIAYTPDENITAGTAVVYNQRTYVADRDMVAGRPNSFQVGGIYKVDKTTGEGWTGGDAIYFDATTTKFTTVAASNTYAGFADTSATSDAETGVVTLVNNSTVPPSS